MRRSRVSGDAVEMCRRLQTPLGAAGKVCSQQLVGYGLHHSKPFTSLVGQLVGKDSINKRSTGNTSWFYFSTCTSSQNSSNETTISKKQCNFSFSSTDRLKQFKGMHARLLNIPLREYTPQLWAEGKNALYFWMSQLSQEVSEGQEVVYKPISKHEEVSVNLCIQLLDRWALEEGGPPDDVFEGSSTDLVNQVINRWRVAWKFNQTKLSPAEMLEKIDSYLQPNQWIKVDTKTLNMILDGAGHGNQAEWDPRRAPFFAEGLLGRMERDYGASPSEFSFTSVIHTWAKSGLMEAPLKAEELLRQAELSDNTQPNNIMYCAVIDAWAKSSHPEAIVRSEALAKEMEASSLPNVFPDTNVLCCILFGLALRAKHHGASSRAHGILKSMLHSYLEEGNINLKPNQRCFTNVITAFARTGQALQAQNVLDEMEALFARTEDLDFRPDAWCYTAVLDAWAKEGNIERAKVTIRKMQDVAESTGDPSLLPTNVSMNALLHAMAKEQKMNRRQRLENDLVVRAKAILQSMEDLYQHENRIEMKPDVISYGAVIDCFAKSNRSDAAEECEVLLRRMQEKVDAGDLEMRPNATIYSAVINAWSRSNHSYAPDRAEALFNEMVEISERTGDEDTKPTRYTYTSLLTAWARSKRRDALEKAQAVFDQLSKKYNPSDLEYHALLNAWANRGDVARMEDLIQKMLNDYYQHQKQKEKQQETSQSPRHSAGRDRTEKHIMTPCTRFFNLLLSAYSKSRLPDAGKRAESLLVKMQHLHTREGLPTQPDSISLGAVLHSWGKSQQRGAAEHAEKILRHTMTLSPKQSLKPNVICFNTVINAWAKSKEERGAGNGVAAQRAEALLEEMWYRYNNDIDRSVRPDKFTYTGCIAAWARSGHRKSGEKAQELLDNMVTRSAPLAAESGERYADLCPDSVIYRTVMKAWQQEGNEERVRILKEKISH